MLDYTLTVKMADNLEVVIAEADLGSIASETTENASLEFENTCQASDEDDKEVKLMNNDNCYGNPDIAETDREKHTTDHQQPQTISKTQQEQPNNKLPSEEQDKPTMERSKVVRITGIADSTTTDALLNFFENKRRSGGGEIIGIHHISDKQLADITFKSPEDAERVSKMEDLVLDEAKLTTSLKEIPKVLPKDDHRLHVMGISDATSKDGFLMFMEVVSGEEVQETIFGSNWNALVTFKKTPDFDKIHKICSIKVLDGSHVTVQRINICNCIEVTGLSPMTTRDTILYYFENTRKSDGGDVQKVEYEDGETTALIFFDDLSAVDRVLTRAHIIDSVDVNVSVHYPFLGEISKKPEGRRKEKLLRVDPKTMEFIVKFLQQEFQDLSHETCVKWAWQPGAEDLVLSPTDKKLDKVKWEDACSAIEDYINQIISRQITVSEPEAFEELSEKALEKYTSFKDRVGIECKEKEGYIWLQGKKQDVELLTEQLDVLSEEINQKIKDEKAKITNEIPLLKNQFDLLILIDFDKKLNKQFKDLETTMVRRDYKFSLKGPDQVVQKGNSSVWQTLAKLKEQEVEFPKSIVEILASEAGELFVVQEFISQNIDAVVSFEASDSTKLLVTAVDRKEVNRAVEHIKKVTAEESVHLEQDQKPLVHSEDWEKLVNSCEKSLVLRVTTELASSTVWITGIREQVDKVKAEIVKFLEENTIIHRFVRTDTGPQKVLLRYENSSIEKIEEKFKDQLVQIRLSDTEEGITIKGNRNGVEKALGEVQNLIDKVKDRSIDLDKPSTKKLFSETKGMKLLSVVENDHKCIIERCTTTQNKERSRVTTKSEEIVVNAANPKLQHGEGLVKSKTNHDDSFTDILVSPTTDSAEGRGRRAIDAQNQQFSPRTNRPTFDDLPTPTQKIKKILIKGDLSKEKANAIVNTVSSGLDLSQNLCAKALSQAAGPGLQQECKGKGPLKAGSMIVTEGYNLRCQKVFHVVAGEWTKGDGEQMLRSLLNLCLEEADKRGFSSIAFPAIGTGNLKYPRDIVARVFFEEVDAFKKIHPQTCIVEVHFVLYHKDMPTIQAFENELKNREKPKKGKQSGLLRSDRIGSVCVELVTGDITKEKVDAIAHLSNQSLNLSVGGGVGTAIAKAGGTSIQTECNKFGKQQPEAVVRTSAGNLTCSNVYHLVSASLKPGDVTDIVVKGFATAESHGVSSIAIPAIGTGIASIGAKEAAKALLNAVWTFCKTEPSSVKVIRIVVFQERMLQDFYAAIEDLLKTESMDTSDPARHEKSTKPRGGNRKSYRSSSSETAPRHQTAAANSVGDVPYSEIGRMWLKVFASDIKQLDKAKHAINELISLHSKKKYFEDPAMKELSQAQEDRIKELQAKHSTEILIEKRIGRIVISGISDDVSEAALEVVEILKKKSENEQKRKYAELVANKVQWYFKQGNEKEEPYENEDNAMIEQAYSDKKSSIQLRFWNEHKIVESYQIDFHSMEETNLNTGAKAHVLRKENLCSGIPLPHHWDPQPKDTDGKEKDLHIVQLDPVKQKQEYDEVKNAIKMSTPMKIVKIERVQNPELYRGYMVKKQIMDDKNGSNEKKLFHGTSVDTCSLINHKGFNRSYCGKNATMYGKGVYFARDASYSKSSTYSPPGPSGQRCMYLASVLVGEYTQGSSSMIVPPQKNPTSPTITYDSTVDNVSNPSIYVAFHDNQVYPHYLITFL